MAINEYYLNMKSKFLEIFEYPDFLTIDYDIDPFGECLLMFFIFWLGLFFILLIILKLFLRYQNIHTISKEDQGDCINRTISTFNAIYLALTSSIFLGFYNTRDWSEKNTLLEHLVCINFLAYNIYDQISMWIVGNSDRMMELHHAACISTLYLVLTTNHSSRIFCVVVYCSEISNPFQHIRKILMNMGLKKTKLKELVEDMFFFMFLTHRTIGFGYCQYLVIVTENTHYLIKIGFFVLFAQSLGFIYIMNNIKNKRDKENILLKEHGINIYWLQENPDIKKFVKSIKEKKEREAKRE